MNADIARFASRYDRSREEEYSLKNIGDLPSGRIRLRRRPTHVDGHRPARLIDTQRGSRLSRMLQPKVLNIQPSAVLRHGRRPSAGGGLLPPCLRRAWKEKADSVFAGPGGGGEVVDCRKAQRADAAPFGLHQGLATVNESPAGAVPADRIAARFWKKNSAFPRRYLRTIPSPWAVKRLHEFNSGDINQFPRGQALPSVLRQIAWPRPSRAAKTNRIFPALVGRWTFAMENTPRTTRTPTAIPATCAPGQPGLAGICGNVPGADQVPSAADRRPGRQLQGHRGTAPFPLRA